MELKHASIAFDKKAVNEDGTFEGYGSVFGNVDFGGDVVVKGAFSKSLKEWSQKGQLPAMFWHHDRTDPIGDWLEMREDSIGLFVKGRLWVHGDRRTESAIKAWNLFTGTGPKGLSIGYITDESGEEIVDGKRVRMLKQVSLMEISPLPFGMNNKAVITRAKSLALDGEVIGIREFEKFLRDAGLSRQQAKALLSEGYNGIKRDDDDQENLITSLKNLNSLFSNKEF